MSNGQKKAKQTAITPLTLFVPLKQDAASQTTAKSIAAGFVPGTILPSNETLHFLRVTLIPNPGGTGASGLLLATIFDGAMDPYLSFFWNRPNFQTQWAALCTVMVNPPADPTSFPEFETYINANNLNTQGQLSFGYTASAAQIAAAFPPGSAVTINPLTLYIPLKQDGAAQLVAEAGQLALSGNVIPSNTLIHFALVALVPNNPPTQHPAGFLLLTCFDGAMDPYLTFFWSQDAIRALWIALAQAATNGPPIWDRFNYNTFQTYINDNDLLQVGDLSAAYTAPLQVIAAKFPPPTPTQS